MKKIIIIMTVMFTVALAANCNRGFRGYTADGNGGFIRYGIKHNAFTFNPSYAEHCTPVAGKLECKEIKVNYQK